ncbi:hypothetical protein [Desulfitobacterium sp. LBE]|uniref:hypothetical protein n=1 Tax=Desulfitobacterium sp. LBE TaxID=884086 RepID=UPI00119FBA5A|nr:hypothetical protein [Desulfitobacterium sp. LBE]
MELKMFYEQYNRIQFEASILLLEQNYLSMGGEKDPIWQKVSTEIYPELNLSPLKADYPSLWQQIVKNAADG